MAADDSCHPLGRQEFFCVRTMTVDRVVPDALDRLRPLALDAGAPDVADEARELADRAAAGRFYVACIGQFKRGKSTLINALLEDALLPAGVPPVTAVPTIVRAGERGARVRTASGWRPIPIEDLGRYVSEDGNPGNTRSVLAVEAFSPSPLLAGGLCLVDTPGLGSVIEANTAATREFLPHVDAVIAVLGVDPPIAADEMTFLAETARQADTILFVLNKADRLSPEQRAEAVAFTERVLCERLGRAPERFYQVSALPDRRTPETAAEWAALVERLRGLADVAGARLVDAAVRRGVARLGGRLRWALAEERRALLAPVQEAETRAATLRDLAADADRALGDLGPLLLAEHQRLGRAFVAARQQFLGQAVPAARQVIEQRLAQAENGLPLRRARALALAHRAAREHLEPWLQAAEQQAQRVYATVTARFADIARTLLEQLTTAAGITPDAWSPDDLVPEGLSAPPTFHFASRMTYHYASVPWAAWLADQLTPPGARARRVRAAAVAYLTDLLEVNAERVENDLDQRVMESRRQFEFRFRRVLEAIVHLASESLERARAARAAGRDAVAAEIRRIDAALEELSDLLGGA
jgi:GTP-binding protein EngB required for normal cell division